MTLAHTIDGNGPEPVLALHDWLGDSTNYDASLPYLDLAQVTFARVDLPGYGASRDLPRCGVGSDLDRAVLDVADVLRWRRFHLVAHSMSTVIAQRIARSAVDRIASITLVAPVTPGTELPNEITQAIRAVGADPNLRRGALGAQWGSRLSSRWLEFKLSRWAETSDPAAVAMYVDLFARPELPTSRAEPSVPLQAITGAHDAPHFRREAVEPAIRAVYPDAEFDEIASSSHYPMQETPPLFASRVEAFVRRNSIAR